MKIILKISPEFLVDLFVRDIKTCNGVLYRPNIVLTTATYFQVPTSMIHAEINQNNKTTSHNVDKVFIHPFYKPGHSPQYNLALLYITKDANTSSGKIKVSCMPDPAPSLNIIGWGWEKNLWGNSMEKLMNLTLSVYPQDECNNLYGNKLHANQFCAGNVDDNERVNFISEGGPLINYQTLVPRLIGIYSWSESTLKLDGEYKPPTFIEICKFKHWIAQVHADVRMEHQLASQIEFID